MTEGGQRFMLGRTSTDLVSKKLEYTACRLGSLKPIDISALNLCHFLDSATSPFDVIQVLKGGRSNWITGWSICSLQDG
jgi:hypothetical protein